MLPTQDWSLLTTVLFTGAFTLLIVKIWQTYQYLNTFKRMGIPGPTPLPLLGSSLTLGKMGFKDVFEMWNKQYGKVYGVFLPKPVLIVTDETLIREILVKKFPDFANRSDIFTMETDETTRDNLLCLRGDHWKHVRSQLSPTFSSNKLKQMVPAIERVAKNLQICLKDKAAKGGAIELKGLCKNIAMDVVAGVAFGFQSDSVLGIPDPFSQHVNSMMTTFGKRLPFFMTFPWLGRLVARCGITPFAKTDTRFLVSVIDSALKDRRMDTQSHGDFLQLLLEAQQAQSSEEAVDAEIDFTRELRTSSKWTRKGLTLSEMHANVVLFVFAGNDTVATVMAMTLFSLAAHPHCLRKAQQEVDDKVGKEPVTYNAAMSLNYMDMCMNESMRLHLPVLLERQVAEDVVIGGHRLPRGSSVAIPNNVLHLDPKFWPDPLTFDPERFTAEARAARPSEAFLPFGMGPRNCIGMRLGQLEVRLVLASLLQRYTPVLCDQSVYPPQLKPLTSEARAGMWIKLEARQDEC